MKMRFWKLFSMSVLAFVVLCACGDAGAKTQPTDAVTDASVTESGKTDGTVATKSGDSNFTFAINYMPTSLLPVTGNDDFTSMIRPIYDQLYAETKDGIDYFLANNVEISEDRKTYTLTLHPDANWSDGKPVIVDDVLFKINYGGLNSGGKTSLNTINGKDVIFNKIDDKTLEIVLPEAYALYTASLGSIVPMPAHPFDNDPAKAENNPYFNSTDMATSGAYTVEQINEDSIIYSRRDDYFRGVPDPEKVILKMIGAGSTKQVAFENGEISYMRVTTAEELAKYEDQPEKYNVASVSESRLNYFQINPHGPSNLSDDARKAIFLALNGQEIVDIAFGSEKLASPANSLLTPDQAYYTKDNKKIEHNLEEAKKLAKSSGLKGQTLIYVYNADRANMEAVATVIQQQLQQIGVNLAIEGLDSPTFFQRFFALSFNSGLENTWDLGTNGWDSERGSSLYQAYGYTNRNREHWGFTEEIAEIANRATQATNEEDKKAATLEFQDKTLEVYRIFPLTYTNFVMVSQKNVTGLDGNTVVPEFIDYMTIKID